MTAPDAQTAGHRLGHALAQWRQWQCAPPLSAAPELEGAFDAGVSNYSFLVASEGQRFVVRVDGVKSSRHGLSRSAELQILRSAHGAGIAPPACYFNPDLGVLVTAYLPPDSDQSVPAEELARLLRQIHALPPRHYRLDLAERLARYQGQLQGASLAPLSALQQESIEYCLHNCREDSPPLLCHNDLVPANLLRCNGSLYALDWEYSAMGNPFFDIAGAALGQGLATGQDRALLDAYLGAPASAAQRAALQRQRVLCRYIELLWYLVEAEQNAADAVLERHLPLLDSEVAALA